MKRRKNKKLKVSVSLPRLSVVHSNTNEFYEKAVKLYLTRLGISKRLQNTLSIKEIFI